MEKINFIDSIKSLCKDDACFTMNNTKYYLGPRSNDLSALADEYEKKCSVCGMNVATKKPHDSVMCFDCYEKALGEKNELCKHKIL